MQVAGGKAGEIVRKWYVVDADGQTLGRLASQVARVLMGKENPQYTPFLDTGDHVIVVMSTYFPKAGEIVRKWYVVDADGQTLGRLASQVARVLMGKENPQYTPFLDTGDHVIVVNAEKIRTTGVKSEQKQYHHYTGYPGGLRTEDYRKRLARKPEKIIEDAVRRMLPKNKLAAHMLSKLNVYKGDKHPHEAQKPQGLKLEVRA
jgi:large subunit ribosomal protein L13